MGGRPLEALALLAIGVERLSITPAAIGPVKAMVRSVGLVAVRAAMQGWLAVANPAIRGDLAAFAAAAGVALG